MSNAFLRTAANNLPPVVPIEFTADDATTAIPASNNLNVLTRDTTDNNANGIQTTADPNNSDNLYIELTNRVRVTSTTSDGAGQTQTVTIFTPQSASGIVFDVSFLGYDSTNNEVTGGKLEGIARSSGGAVVVVVGTNDTLDEADAGLIASDWDIITDGTVIQAQFVGVAGRTINWSAVFIYDQTT